MPANSDFFQRLESRIAPYNLLTHSFYRAWTAGELTKDDLREYAAEYWHHVSAFPTYLSALHSRLEDTELRRTVLRNSVRKVEEAIASGDRTAAMTAIKEAEPAIMRAAQRGVVHKNTASRKVSRLVHRIAKLAAK